jgi:hypothetical protein
MPVATPQASVMAQWSKALSDKLEDEGWEQEMAALMKGHEINEGVIDNRFINMTARAEAAMQRIVEVTSAPENNVTNRAIQTYYLLQMFRQVAGVSMAGPDNRHVPLSEIERYG